MLDQKVFRNLINQQLESSRLQLSDSTDSAATIVLDQNRVGRLSRMDALQAQSMQTELLNRVRIKIAALEKALVKLESDDFGWCEACEEEIAIERLRHNPAVKFCIACAEKKE